MKINPRVAWVNSLVLIKYSKNFGTDRIQVGFKYLGSEKMIYPTLSNLIDIFHIYLKFYKII